MVNSSMDYEIVIATRNRAEALALSIPLMLAQSRPPRRLIIVDSSDDHAEIARTVREAASGSPIEVKLRHTEPGVTLQRNLALLDVEAPVVFFGDDDSLWYPGFAQAIMEVYERDKDGLIGGVTGVKAGAPPSRGAAAATYDMSRAMRLRQAIAYPRARLENWAFTDPLVIHGRELVLRHEMPDWLSELDAVPVEFMTGFRMTFRTDELRCAGGFDVRLSAARRAEFEDVDACFGVAERKLLVGSHRALVYHHQFPSGRGSGRVRGATSIANRAYVVAKHAGHQSVARRRVRPYSVFRCAQYAVGVKGEFGRSRLIGALDATRRINPILNARREDVGERYLAVIRALGLHERG